jgi:hypothetical protein
MLKRILDFLYGRSLVNRDNPFENVRLQVLVSISILFIVLNIPYSVLSFEASLVGFATSIIQDATLITIVTMIQKGKHVKFAIILFIVNMWFQNLFHFYVNNGILLEQGIIFYMLSIIISFILLGRSGGYISSVIVATLIIIGLYNEINDCALFRAPQELMDPPMLKEMKYFILLPLTLCIFLLGAYFRAQLRSEKQMKKQKDLIESKNKEITDGMRYAFNIQRAQLPVHSHIDRTLDRLKSDAGIH